MLKHVYWTEDRDDPNQVCNAFFVSALQLRFLLLLVLNYFYKALGLDISLKENINVFKIF